MKVSIPYVKCTFNKKDCHNRATVDSKLCGTHYRSSLHRCSKTLGKEAKSVLVNTKINLTETLVTLKQLNAKVQEHYYPVDKGWFSRGESSTHWIHLPTCLK